MSTDLDYLNNLTTIDFIDQVYNIIYTRAPLEREVRDSLQLLNSGKSRYQFLLDIIDDSDYPNNDRISDIIDVKAVKKRAAKEALLRRPIIGRALAAIKLNLTARGHRIALIEQRRSSLSTAKQLNELINKVDDLEVKLAVSNQVIEELRSELRLFHRAWFNKVKNNED